MAKNKTLMAFGSVGERCPRFLFLNEEKKEAKANNQRGSLGGSGIMLTFVGEKIKR